MGRACALESLADLHEKIAYRYPRGICYRSIGTAFTGTPPEGSGIVEEAPSGSGFAAGDKVFFLSGKSGAEFVAVHQRTVAAAPSQMSMEEAAATPLALLTAYHTEFVLTPSWNTPTRSFVRFVRPSRTGLSRFAKK